MTVFITVGSDGYKVPVLAFFVDGLFAVTQSYCDESTYQVTHLPTGCSCGEFDREATARAYLDVCRRIAANNPGHWNLTDRAEWRAGMTAIASDIATLKREREALGGRRITA